ncbi:histidinol-phosphatase [Oleiagrimonas sp. C23AA]|uniref:histidinol-phosphatase n=1 Tax=Oleiagrimonas sp. C23AA TaxID=2719047 RepID=UPI001420BEFE|nr:histidinol-phosphatase [Oleiagrimonas sp. C23AA]NII10777.1 histidinol-phosphatase [Oleiagrimonas sp. C23AA]
MAVLTPPGIEATTFMRFAEDLADRARKLSLPAFRHHLEVQLKPDESPVTRVDRDVESMLRRTINAAWPEHGIVGEEHGGKHADAPYVWSLDPIDGTRSFITGWPLWGTLIALLREGQPMLGLIDIPVLGERWLGWRGEGTWANGNPCRSNGCQRLRDATIYTTSPDIFCENESDAFERVCAAAAGRRFGGDCYSYAMLASGHVDAVVEADLKPYDFLALAPVVEAAGGVISDWQGGALGLHSGGQVVAAATPGLHRQLLEKLAECPQR